MPESDDYGYDPDAKRARLPKNMRDLQRQINRRLSTIEWRVRVIAIAYLPILIAIIWLWDRTA